MLQLKLVDLNNALCESWKKAFADLPNVTIYNQRFEKIEEFDCMVSPANSHGFMDGGIDAAITALFGQQLMDRVQKHIISHYRGEQPVGTSFIIETKQIKHPYLAHTPTMRVPRDIRNTDIPYLAMYAMLLAVHHFNEANNNAIGTILCPGLGTLSGMVSNESGAKQMALAYKHFLNPPSNLRKQDVVQRDQAIWEAVAQINTSS